MVVKKHPKPSPSRVDASLLHHVIQLRRPWLDDVMILASALGSGGFIWIIFGSIAGIFPRHTAGMWRLWLAVAFTFVVVDDVVKPFANRARPFETLSDVQLIDQRPTSQSFSSGHAAMAVAGIPRGCADDPGSRLDPLAVGWCRFGVARLPRRPLADRRHRWAIGLACAWFVLGGRLIRGRA
jgi:hypothetical protein